MGTSNVKTKALKIVTVSLIVLTVFIAAATTLITSFDLSWVKQEVSRFVKEEKQRHLIIEGDLRLSLFPRPSIRLGKTSLSEFQSHQEFARIDNTLISVQLIPLLSKKLIIDHVELSGIHARLVRHTDGRFNFDNLLATKSSRPPTFEFAIGETRLNGDVEFHDESQNRSFHMQHLTLKSGRIANQSSGPLDLSGQFKQGNQTLQFSLSTHYHLDLEGKRFRLEQLESQITDHTTNPSQLKVKLNAAALEKEGNKIRIQGLQSKLAAKFGDTSFSGMLAIAHLEKTEENKIKTNPITVQWDIQQDQTRLCGQLTSVANIDPKKESFSLPQLTGIIEIENPSIRTKQLKLPVTGTLESNLADNTLAGTLNTHFDETTALSIWKAQTFSPFSLHFNVMIDQINLDKYILTEQNRPARPPASSQKGIDNLNKPPSTSNKTVIEGIAEIGSLRVGNNRIQNIKAHINLSDGKTHLAPSP